MSSRLGSWLERSRTSKRAAAFTIGSIVPATVHRTTSPCASTSRTPGSPANASAGTGEAKWNSTMRTARAFNDPTSSTVISRPSRMIPTRSHTRSTSGRSCEERKTVCPAARASNTSDWNRCCMIGSSPWVGSSRISRGGRCMNACINPSFCLFPWERDAIFADRSLSRRSASSSIAFPVDPTTERAEIVEVLPAGHVLVGRELAGEVPDAPMDLDAGGPCVQAEHGRAARCRPDEVEQRPDRRRLAGAVRTEEPEHLSGLDRHRDVDDAAGGAVRLREVLGDDDPVDVHGPRLYPMRRGRWATKSTIGLASSPSSSSWSFRQIAWFAT